MSMSEEKPIRILIADDHPVVREGLAAVFSNIPELELVGAAKDGVETVEMTRALKPDVILLDLVMPRMDGIVAITEIKAEDPEARILVVTSFADDDKVFPAIKAGASGYLLKDTPPESLIQAIHDVHAGKSSLHPSVARKVLRELTGPSSRRPENGSLTEREVEVLALLNRYLTNKEIAEALVVSPSTVKTHTLNIYRKLEVRGRQQAVARAQELGILPQLR